jgi:hypothetical protein
MVEAAGVEPDTRVENTQVIDSENARIGMISEIAKSTVRSLCGHFPDFLQLPDSTYGRPNFAKEHPEVRLQYFTDALYNWGEHRNNVLALRGANHLGLSDSRFVSSGDSRCLIIARKARMVGTGRFELPTPRAPRGGGCSNPLLLPVARVVILPFYQA